MIMTTRRTFIRNTSLAAGAFALNPAPYSLNPSDKIRVALIGCRNMGFGDLENAIKQPGVECVALCDVDDDILKKRAEEVGKRTGKVPATYKDFRRSWMIRP
jgi:ornithine cyclodeaminase/alanine dehydrogenase-like protein (mu-crystallin family)